MELMAVASTKSKRRLSGFLSSNPAEMTMPRDGEVSGKQLQSPDEPKTGKDSKIAK